MTKSIAELDKNFAVKDCIDGTEIDFYNVRKEPFDIYGLYNPQAEPIFRRLPEDAAQSVSEGVAELSKHTSGGRIRFRTNSKTVVIKADMKVIEPMPHMPLTGSSGFDLYVKENNSYLYKGTFIPAQSENGYVSTVNLEKSEMHDITINFPLYNGVNNVYIGIIAGSELSKGDGYRDFLPTVYYGSSITQGGCASRPGNNYCTVLSRKYDVDFINLGFSGNAKAEKAISDYISSLPMSAFVFDYDHNAPTAEHLKATHEPMYNAVRAANPEIPVIFISRPKVRLGNDEKERRSIIYSTYRKAKSNGDNVYFVDGEQIFEILGGDSGSVDGCHPNDLGFMCMAKSLDDIFAEIYK